MILRLIHAGAPAKGPLGQAADDYRRRLGKVARVDEAFVKAAPVRRASAAEVRRALDGEAERLLARVGPHDRLVVLDREGKHLSSRDLARQLDRWRHEGPTAICIALGSAHGLADTLRERAHLRWSLGAMTLPHDLARVVLWEQLYRADSILRGTPYHK